MWNYIKDRILYYTIKWLADEPEDFNANTELQQFIIVMSKLDPDMDVIMYLFLDSHRITIKGDDKHEHAGITFCFTKKGEFIKII